MAPRPGGGRVGFGPQAVVQAVHVEEAGAARVDDGREEPRSGDSPAHPFGAPVPAAGDRLPALESHLDLHRPGDLAEPLDHDGRLEGACRIRGSPVRPVRSFADEAGGRPGTARCGGSDGVVGSPRRGPASFDEVACLGTRDLAENAEEVARRRVPESIAAHVLPQRGQERLLPGRPGHRLEEERRARVGVRPHGRVVEEAPRLAQRRVGAREDGLVERLLRFPLGERPRQRAQRNLDSECVHDRARRSQDLRGGPRGDPAHQPLVQVRLARLVGSDYSLEPLVRQLVQCHRAGLASRGGREPGRPAGDERRVLHRFGAGARGRVDDRQDRVGIGRQPRSVESEPFARGTEVTLPRPAMVGLEEEKDVDTRETLRGDTLLLHLESGGEGEGEVVDVLGSGVDADAPRRLVRLRDDAPRDGDLSLHLVGKEEGDVVVAEVGEELRRGAEGPRAPAGVRGLGELREPLPCEHEVVLPAGSEDATRQTRLEVDLEDENVAGAHRPWERDAGQRPVFGVVIRGGLEGDLARQVGPVGEGDPFQLAESEGGGARRRGKSPPESGPRVAEAVQIKVENDVGELMGRPVDEGDRLPAGERLLLRVPGRLDPVGGDGGHPRSSERGEGGQEKGRKTEDRHSPLHGGDARRAGRFWEGPAREAQDVDGDGGADGQEDDPGRAPVSHPDRCREKDSPEEEERTRLRRAPQPSPLDPVS